MYAAVAGKRRERTSSIAPARKNKLVAPLELQGRCTTEVVDAYFEQVLRPARSPARVSVRDNARFHQSPTAQKLVEAAAGQVLFLPAYAPAFKPLEQLWTALKTRLRKALATASNPFLFTSRAIPYIMQHDPAGRDDKLWVRKPYP